MARVKGTAKVIHVPARAVEEFTEWSQALGCFGFKAVSFDYSEERGVIAANCEKNGTKHTITPELKEIVCR